MPELLDGLMPANTSVTPDAMDCQKDGAQRIVDREAGYPLALKANRGGGHAAVRRHFEARCSGPRTAIGPVFDAFDDSHGRLVRRRAFADPRAASLETLEDWPKLETVLAAEAIRGVDGSDEVEAEIRRFLSGSAGDPSTLAQAIRRHWPIENGLHRVLDATFRADDCRIRDPTAARNFAPPRKIAINPITRDRSTEASLRGKRKKAKLSRETSQIAGDAGGATGGRPAPIPARLFRCNIGRSDAIFNHVKAATHPA